MDISTAKELSVFEIAARLIASQNLFNRTSPESRQYWAHGKDMGFWTLVALAKMSGIRLDYSESTNWVECLPVSRIG